jgi:pimeloyl-ACP methyl ester carboxylesterase
MSIFLLLGLLYILFCLLFYFGQHYFFFRPEILPSEFKYQYPFPFEELHFDMEDGGKINAVYFKVPNAKGVVFYLKGNSRSIKGWGKFAKDFVGKGYDFFLIDYRGFGKSRGKSSEHILYSDSQFAYKWLVERYTEKRIVLYGRSFGSGIAARIASWNNPSMLILDAPYYSFQYQVRRFGFWLPLKWLLKYKIPTNRFLKKTSCPVFILHGDRDFLISYQQGVELQKINPQNIKLLTIPKASHNNMPDFPLYHDLLYEILHANPDISTQEKILD